MRIAAALRTPGALAMAWVLSACGGSPSAPDPTNTVEVATGPQVLRLTYQGTCSAFGAGGLIPFIYTRVTVTRTSSQWIAAASSPAAGDVELRFHATGASVITGSMPIQGTIRGTAIHSPDVLPSLPPSDTRATFSTDGGASLSGFAYATTSITPNGGVGGIGSGAVAISNGAGNSCAGSTFSWALGSQG